MSEWTETDQILSRQDDCLLAMLDGGPPPLSAVLELPPWRAVTVARIGLRLGVVREDAVVLLAAEARRVGGSGTLAGSPGLRYAFRPLEPEEEEP